VSLLIQKSVAKNFVVADSKMSSKTTLLSIQKSIAKNCIATDLEIGSDGGVILDLLLFFLFFTNVVFLNLRCYFCSLSFI
jgi:hypothetical protein